MSEGFGDIGNVSLAASRAVAFTPPAAATSAGSAAFEDTLSAKPATPPTSSPRIQFDPVAGVILQFLDSSGEVEAQSPSFAAVAYLKAGLTSEGFNDKSEAESSDTPAHTQITA